MIGWFAIGASRARGWCAGAARAMLCALALWAAAVPAWAVDDGITDYVTIPTGSYIVNMGISPQTTANALRPYGLVWDLVKNYKTPVAWAVNPSKTLDTDIDFTDPNSGVSYRTGAFIIDARFVSATTVSVINTWKASGVVVNGPTTGPINNVPIYDYIQGVANVVLDLQNGSIAAAFLTAAGVPSSAYTYKTPASLNSCDDFFAMPHADPTWSTHGNLVNFVRTKGYFWAGCHAVSVLENLDDPTTPATNPDMNFLSQTGLVPFGSHNDGSPPYTTTGYGNPVMQFLGTTDLAQQNGSERIYLPKAAGGWRPGVSVLVADPTQADVPGVSPGPAAAIVMGRAFGDAANGRVMYEAGHNVGGTAAANIAAQRAFLNFWILGLIDRSPGAGITAAVTAVNEGGIITLNGIVNYPFPVTYQWSSSSGGTFGTPTSQNTTFTPPEVTGTQTFFLRLTVTDGCGRSATALYPVTVTNVVKADLAITKTDSADPVAVSSNYTYTLSISNLGTDPASSVSVVDTLPAGLTFVSATGIGWTCNYAAPNVTCTRPTLAVTGSNPASTITLTVTAPGANTFLTNTATVSSSTPDMNTDNNTATETTQVLSGIDVSVVKTAPAGSFYPGQAFTYTLTVNNVSAAAATSLTVKDIFPTSLTFVSATASGWDCVYNSAERTGTCFRASLAASTSSVITVTVIPTGSAGDTINNTATITSPDFVDQVPANNTSTVGITLSATADLALTKTGSVTTTGNAANQKDTYIVTVTNNGPGTATGVSVNDQMSGLHFNRYSPAQGGNGCTATPSVGSVSPSSPWSTATLAVGGGGTWTIGSMANGASATLTLVCSGDNQNGVTNTATVTSTSYDPVSTNNTASAYVQEGAVTTVDIAITKTATATVLTGANITYQLTVSNVGATNGNNHYTVVDTLPAGTTFVSASGTNWTCVHSSGVVTCDTDTDRPAGTSHNVITIVATAPSTSGTLINSATVTYTVGNSQNDPPGNNTATASTVVSYPTTDINVTKTVNNATPMLGSNVVFTIKAGNIGANAATNVRVQDLLPAGFNYNSSTVSQGSYDRNTGLWYIGSLATSTTVTMTITASAGLGATSNTACFYAMDQTDSSSANDCATVAVTPRYADLALTKSAASPTVNLNSNAVFTVTLTNNGPSSVSSITVQENLPSGLEFVSATPSSGSYNSSSNVWTVPGPLANGASVTLTLTAKVTAANQLLTNNASITSANLPDTVSTNNSASASVTGASADIAVTKVVDNATPPINTLLTFTITATNNGPTTATNVILSDVLPAGLTYSANTPSQGTFTSPTWTVGTLAVGASATLALQATNTAFGTLVNTVTKTSMTQYDPDSTNDSASVSVLSGGSADLEVTKTVNLPNTFVGGNVAFNIRLRNLGPQAASGVVITDVLPAGLTYLSHSASQGTYNTPTGVWTVGAVAVNQTINLQLNATANASGIWVNTAAVTAMNQADPDTSNNSSSASVDSKPAADLAITKSGTTSAALGAPVTFTMVATNNGPNNVTGATIVDTVPAAFTAVSWTCVATGTADCDTTAGGTGASGSSNVISLSNVLINAGAGNSLTITVNGTASTTTTAVNTVIISPPSNNTVFETNTANNSASVTTVIANVTLTGRVFADTGTTAGIANNGIRDGGELGIAKVTVALTNCAATVHATTTTEGDGTYALVIPSSVAVGATLCVVQTNLTGYVSTGGGVGNTGGTYDRSTDRVQFTLAASTNYSNVNFADVPENRLLTDGAKTAVPGTTVSYTHVFTAGTAGTVTFSLTASASPAVTGWTQLLYNDVNCDGILSTPGDTQITLPLAVTENQRVCLLVQQFVPAGLASGASNVVIVQANFAYSNASPAILSSYTRQDVTTTSSRALDLRKEVRNITQGGSFVLSNEAKDGDELEYRITYTNSASTTIQNLQVRDTTPSFTVFVSAACGTPLPANLSACVITAPPALSSNGAIQWQFTGSLAPGVSGTVTYIVKLQ